MKIKISAVIVGDRKRKLDTMKVSEIADSIKEVGLLHPITIDSSFHLLAGLHRLEAHKLLGLSEIEAEIKDLEPLKLELVEIDENLIRSNLHYIERGEHLKRRKEIYELLHPEAKVGGDRKSEGFLAKKSEGQAPSFAKDAANKTALTERSIQQEVQIASRLNSEVKDEVRKIDLPKNEALHLIRTVPRVEDQIKVLSKIKDKKARTVRDAKSQLDLEAEVEKGKVVKYELDATFLTGSWDQVLSQTVPGTVSLIVTSISDVDFSGIQKLIDLSAVALKDGGIFAIQLNHHQLYHISNCTLPKGLIYRWVYANLLVSSHDKDGIKSSWVPIVVLSKGLKRLAGSDIFQKAFDSLTKVEDYSLQIVTRFSSVGDFVLDPIYSTGLLTFVSAAVGRKYVGVCSDERASNQARAKLSEIKDIIASL